MRFTIDASVHLNALRRAEKGSADSRALLAALHRPMLSPGEKSHEIFVPTLLLVEVAASVARTLDDTARGIAVAEALQHLPRQIWIALGEGLAAEAWRLAACDRLRGADAVYGAVAQRFGAVLVTRDRQQLERLTTGIVARRPEDVMDDNL